MTVFSAVEAHPPPGFVLVPPNAFRSDFPNRPTEPVAVGLRLVSQTDLQTARAQARETASQAIPDVKLDDPNDIQAWTDAYNDRLMSYIVSQATCDANDVLEPWSFVRMAPEDLVPLYLTADGIKLIFDKWEQVKISLDPTQREATDDEVDNLLDTLREREDGLSFVRRARIRRLLAYVHDELTH